MKHQAQIFCMNPLPGIHMKYQVLFSLKNNKKKYLRLSSAAVVIGPSGLKSKGIPLCFSSIFSNNFCDFLFVSQYDKILPNRT